MAEDLAIDQARGVMARIDGFLGTASDIDCDGGYGWITGWTSEVVAVAGLVVAIQTTRLVLFEFFLRFFEGRGRRFRPLPEPPAAGRGRRRD
jgi:hypothetical protein